MIHLKNQQNHLSELVTHLVERQFRVCVVPNVTGLSHDLYPWPFISSIYLVMYELALLFYLIVLRTGYWPVGTSKVKKGRLASNKHNKCEWRFASADVNVCTLCLSQTQKMSLLLASRYRRPSLALLQSSCSNYVIMVSVRLQKLQSILVRLLRVCIRLKKLVGVSS